MIGKIQKIMMTEHLSGLRSFIAKLVLMTGGKRKRFEALRFLQLEKKIKRMWILQCAVLRKTSRTRDVASQMTLPTKNV